MNFQTRFSRKRSVLQKNFTPRSLLIFARKIIPCRLFSSAMPDKFSNSIFSKTKASMKKWTLFHSFFSTLFGITYWYTLEHSVLRVGGSVFQSFSVVAHLRKAKYLTVRPILFRASYFPASVRETRISNGFMQNTALPFSTAFCREPLF